MLRDVLDFQEQLRRTCPTVSWGHGANRGSGPRPPGAGQASSRCTTPSPPERARSNSVEQANRRRAPNSGKTAANRLIGAQAQEGLRRGVQVPHVQILIQQERRW